MLTIGSVVGDRYQVDSFLGRAPAADVYLGVDRRRRAPVVLKELHPGLAENAAFMDALRRQAGLLAETRHPSLVGIRDILQDGRSALLVEDYVRGGSSLAYFLHATAGPLPLLEATRILNALAAALAHVHNLGLAHGAVEPANIILADRKVLLAGLGLATAAAQAGIPPSAVATPAYLSPEQLAGAPPNAASDVYGLGVILFEMTTGEFPFPLTPGTMAGPQETAGVGPATPPRDPQASNPALPSAAAAVMRRALAPNPAERWANTDEMARAWGSAPLAHPLSHSAATAAAAVPGAPVPDYVASPPTATGGPFPVPGNAPWRTIGIVCLIGLLGLATLFALRAGVRTLIASGPAVAAAIETRTPAAPAASRTGAPRPTATRTATATAPAAGIAPATATATPPVLPTTVASSGPYAVTNTAVNLRDGPGTNFAVIGGALAGSQVAVTGRNQAGDWLQTCCINGRSGWIFAGLVTTHGDVGAVPVVAPANGPTATSVAAPATATPTATVVAAVLPSPTPGNGPGTTCPSAPPDPFGGLPDWQNRLGCPLRQPAQTDFAHQFFEHGQMIYRHDLGTIYVLYADGTWAGYKDTYVDGQPFQAHQFSPPTGLQQPIKGFDRVWERPEVREKIGWATRGEVGVIRGPALTFQKGTAFRIASSGYLTAYFELFNDGVWTELNR